jgi:hypothetical protein
MHSECKPDSYSSALAIDQRLSYVASKNNAFGYSGVLVERCVKLPPNAAWVSFSNTNVPRVDCYFACKYGLGPGADALQTALRAAATPASRLPTMAKPCDTSASHVRLSKYSFATI